MHVLLPYRLRALQPRVLVKAYLLANIETHARLIAKGNKVGWK